MLLGIIDFGVLLGGTGTLLAAVVGALALLQSRRTEHKTATREEVQQAFDLQDKAMKEIEESNNRLTLEIERVRGRNDAMHESLNGAYAKMAELSAEHRQCRTDLATLGERLDTTQNALHIAEARIAELGG